MESFGGLAVEHLADKSHNRSVRCFDKSSIRESKNDARSHGLIIKANYSQVSRQGTNRSPWIDRFFFF